MTPQPDTGFQNPPITPMLHLPREDPVATPVGGAMNRRLYRDGDPKIKTRTDSGYPITDNGPSILNQAIGQVEAEGAEDAEALLGVFLAEAAF